MAQFDVDPQRTHSILNSVAAETADAATHGGSVIDGVSGAADAAAYQDLISRLYSMRDGVMAPAMDDVLERVETAIAAGEEATGHVVEADQVMRQTSEAASRQSDASVGLGGHGRFGPVR